jgi:bifunctional N-acetylglucosamine-1-phosphate-uridyltransferase/glucosamine-1-phosphate-acetyltransferase GlmU-like protein
VTGEYYITHVPQMLASEGGLVELMPGVAADEAMGVNTPAQRDMVDAALRRRLEAGEMGSGRAIA